MKREVRFRPWYWASLYYTQKEKSKEVTPATEEKASIEATVAEAGEGAAPVIEAEPPPAEETAESRAPETGAEAPIEAIEVVTEEGHAPATTVEPPGEKTAESRAPETGGTLTIKAGAATEAAPAAVVEAAVVADSCTAAADLTEAAPAAKAKAETEAEKSQAREKLFIEVLTLHHQVLWTIMKQFKRYS